MFNPDLLMGFLSWALSELTELKKKNDWQTTVIARLIGERHRAKAEARQWEEKAKYWRNEALRLDKK